MTLTLPLDTKQLKQEEIPQCLFWIRALGALFQDKVSLQTLYGGPSSRQATMIGLGGGALHIMTVRVSTLMQSCSQAEIKLPCLAATHWTRQQVIPLNTGTHVMGKLLLKIC